MTRWQHGQPAEWQTTTEAEFDANERDDWHALWEWRQALCPQCGLPKAICSTSDGTGGDGFHVSKDVCWVTATRMVAERKWRAFHKDAGSDDAGYKPTDGVQLRVGLEETEPDADLDRVLAVIPQDDDDGGGFA